MNEAMEDHAFASGEPTIDADGVSIVLREEGGAMFLPKAAKRLDEAGTAAFSDLFDIGRAYVELDAARLESVVAARQLGVSWHLIGWCLGTTGDAARRRFGESVDSGQS